MRFGEQPQALESKPKGGGMVPEQEVRVSIDALLNRISWQACDLADFNSTPSEPALRKVKGVAKYG